jgi:hypothetical protein
MPPNFMERLIKSLALGAAGLLSSLLRFSASSAQHGSVRIGICELHWRILTPTLERLADPLAWPVRGRWR